MMKETNDKTYTLIDDLLKECHYHIFRNDWEDEVDKMEFTPELPQISKILKTFGVDNFVAKIPKEMFQELPERFIALFKEEEHFITVLVERERGEMVAVTDLSRHEKKIMPLLDAVKMWTGYMISINEKTEQVVTPLNKHSWQVSNIVKYVATLLVICLCLFAATYFSIHPTIIILVIICGVGFVFSYFALLSSLGYYNQNMQRACSVIKKGDCFSVIHSAGAKILRDLSLADFSFMFMSYSFIASLLAINNKDVLIVNILVLPIATVIIIYTVMYQSVIIKQYCLFCLAIAACVFIQSVILWYSIPCHVDAYYVIVDILLAMFVFVVSFLVKSVLKRQITLNLEVKYKNQVYYHPSVLNIVYSNLSLINVDDFYKLPSISLWGEGKVDIIMIVSLSCDYCKEVYLYLQRIKYYFGKKYCVKMLIDGRNIDEISKMVLFRLMELEGYKELESACDDIFIHNMSMKKWLKRWKKPQTNMSNKLLEIELFEDENNIYDVPMIIVDGKVWPNTYRIEDMIHNIHFI